MSNEPIIEVEDEATRARWVLRGELIDSLQSWLIAEQQNRSCGEAVDFVDALEQFIDFKIQQALK